MDTLNIWTDGSIEGGNPGGHGASGWVIKGFAQTVFGTKDLGKSPTMTNNIAEYSAVVGALEWVVKSVIFGGGWFEKVVIHSDSQLVVNQCNDEWNCSAPALSDLRDEVWRLCDKIPVEVVFRWIPREENQEADEISRSVYE